MNSVSDEQFKLVIRKLRKLIKESDFETEFHMFESKLFNRFSAKQICNFLKFFKQANFDLAISKMKEKNDIDIYDYFLDLARFYDSKTDCVSLENVLVLQDEIEKTKHIGYINSFAISIKNKNTENIHKAVIASQKLKASPTLLAVFVFFCKEADEDFIKREAFKIYSQQEMHQFLNALDEFREMHQFSNEMGEFRGANEHKIKKNEIN